jgi:hypothetical protein
MNILFLSDNFPPETNAPASRTFEHAKRWVAAGHNVTVVTGAPNFPSGKVHAGYRNALWSEEVVAGIRVIRVWTYITANEGFFRRSLDYVSFMIAASIASVFVRGSHVIVATSPQFFTPCAAWLVSRIKRLPFVFELRDLWPDSIVAVGAMKETATIRFLRRVEYFLYRKAARIISVTNSFKTVLESNGIESGKIVVVPNGVDLDSYTPGEKPTELVRKWALEGKFVAAYVGTIGMAHGLDTVLAAAELLRAREDVVFLLVGTGAEQASLMKRCQDSGLDNVRFVGAVSKAEVREYWKLCDVALVLLRDTPLFAHVIPSKMFEAMGMERPMILGVRGESRKILEAAHAGLAIEPQRADQLAAALLRLVGDPELRLSLGKAGRAFAADKFNRDRLAIEMLGVLEQTAQLAA